MNNINITDENAANVTEESLVSVGARLRYSSLIAVEKFVTQQASSFPRHYQASIPITSWRRHRHIWISL